MSKGILWEWQSDFNWQLYDIQTMMYIEAEFQKHHKGMDLSYSPLSIPNIIDFTHMVQINKITKKHRPIKRTTTNERYPLAVFQSKSKALTATMLGVPSSGYHPMHHALASGSTTGSIVGPHVPASGHYPMQHSQVSGTTTASSSGSQLTVSSQPINPSPVHNNFTSSPMADYNLEDLVKKMKYIPQRKY